MALSDLIRIRRDARGLTRRELSALLLQENAEAPGSVAAIEAWEYGNRFPQPASLRALSAVLKISDAEIGAALQVDR